MARKQTYEELEKKVKELAKQGEKLKVAEDSLCKSEETLHSIIEHSNELFYLHDTEHTLTYISQTSKDLLGYAKSKEVDIAQGLGVGKYIKKPFLLEKIGLAVKEEL